MRLHKANHGSDSLTYDQEGRFRPQQFEEIFTKYDRDAKGGLNKWEILDFWKGQRLVWDFFGWGATGFECKFFLKFGCCGAYLLFWTSLMSARTG